MEPYPYRADAREAVNRARGLAVEDASLAQLRYAALDVRLAMEAITYSRAQAYSKDLPRSEYGTWQPKKLLGVLIDLDPHAEGGVNVKVAKGPPGSPLQDDYFDFGTETALNMAALKDHYDAVGNRLHMPTMKQLEKSGAHDAARLRKRLLRAIGFLEKVLDSPVFNVVMIGPNSQLDCLRCGHRIRKAIEEGATQMCANCPECGAPHVLDADGKGGFLWSKDAAYIRCANSDCRHEIRIFRDEVQFGFQVQCPGCDALTEVGYCARAVDLPQRQIPMVAAGRLKDL